jgi:acyltransferase
MISQGAQDKGSAIPWAYSSIGISILLVIMAHTRFEYDWVGKYINTFHMPLLFLLLGVISTADQSLDFKQLMIKKAKTLLVPYFIIAFLSYGYFLLRYHYGDPEYYQDLNLVQEFLGIFYSAGTRSWMDFNIPLWLLTGLFVVELMFFGLRRLLRSRLSMAIALLVLSTVGYLDGLYNPVKLPWGIDVACTAIVFYGIGSMAKNAIMKLVNSPIWLRFSLIIIAIPINYMLGFANRRVSINVKVHGNYLEYYVAAFAGIVMVILFMSLIRARWLEHIGRNVLILMACHMPLINISDRIVRLADGLVNNYYAHEVLVGASTALLLMPVIYIIHRYIPFLFGLEGIKLRQTRILNLELNPK